MDQIIRIGMDTGVVSTNRSIWSLNHKQARRETLNLNSPWSEAGVTFAGVATSNDKSARRFMERPIACTQLSLSISAYRETGHRLRANIM